MILKEYISGALLSSNEYAYRPRRPCRLLWQLVSNIFGLLYPFVAPHCEAGSKGLRIHLNEW